MTFEHVVVDEQAYARYREAMHPILEAYGGGFRFDFRVTESLETVPDHPVTRVFGIYFRDEAASSAFFSDPWYARVRQQHFEGAVQGWTVLAGYDREPG